MKNRYTIFRCLTALMSVLVGMCGCSDELDGIRNAATRPSEVICFTASLKDSPTSVSRSSAGHLEMEQEEWLVDTEKVTQVSRGTPTTLLSGSAGIIGYVYNGEWSTSVTPWTGLHNEEYVFDGDELTAKENGVR